MSSETAVCQLNHRSPMHCSWQCSTEVVAFGKKKKKKKFVQIKKINASKSRTFGCTLGMLETTNADRQTVLQNAVFPSRQPLVSLCFTTVFSDVDD